MVFSLSGGAASELLSVNFKATKPLMIKNNIVQIRFIFIDGPWWFKDEVILFDLR